MSLSESPSKKHKKHKKHKHKKHKTDLEEDADASFDYGEDGEDCEDIDVMSSPTTGIKLKIKLGKETVGTTSIQNSNSETSISSSHGQGTWQESTCKVKGEDVFMTKKAGDDTSDEEREWLDALEAGTLDDSGAIKKQKDMSLMTARQRARVSGKPEEPMMQLPTGYKTNELTDEQLERRQQRAKKRREQAHEKQEKDKKLTVDRLLKKQQTRGKGGKNKGSRKSHAPSFSFRSSQQMISISVPQGYQFPFSPQSPKRPSPATTCGVSGCSNMKKYSCSKTGIPLCSLECYKRNLAEHNLRPVPTT